MTPLDVILWALAVLFVAFVALAIVSMVLSAVRSFRRGDRKTPILSSCDDDRLKN